MELFYYLRDSYHRPIGTVCLIETDGHFSRGLAICSDKDNPIKRVGRAIAKGRAIQAFEKKTTEFDILRYEALYALGHTKTLAGEFDWSKSAYEPQLTEFELQLFKKDEKPKVHRFPKLREA